MIDITIATIGRLTKKRAMVYFASPAWRVLAAAPGAGAGLVRTVMPSLHALQPFDDDLLARLEPLLDDPERVDARADLDVAERDLAVGADDGDAVQVLQLLHGALRHEERAGLGVEQQPRAAVLAGPQDAVGVRESRSARRGCRWCGLTARSTGPTVPVCGYTVPSASVSWMPDACVPACAAARVGSRLMMRR